METKNIAIILHQYSIVVKGVERKLKELGYSVTTIEPDADLIRERAAQTDLFILYLPKDSKSREDEMIFDVLINLCDLIQSFKKNFVVIGEKSYRGSLMNAHPILGDCEWVDRPVDMHTLTSAVEKSLTSGGQPKGKKQILIVDDDPSYARMVQAWIKEFYKTDILTSGKQVLMFLSKKKVDLILLDYEMPIMNGSQVLQMLRNDPTTKNIPVVFLTGVGTAEEVKQVLAMKPEGYVLKSATREQLLEYLAEKLN